MKKLVLAAILSIFALASIAAVPTDTTSTNATVIDNPFYAASDVDHPLFAKGKGGAQCKNLPTTCGQMANCAQAKQALKCGNSRLDRDKDGVPCESICPGG